MSITREEEIRRYLANIAWKRGAMKYIDILNDVAHSHKIRPISSSDSHRVGVPCLYIKVKGRGTGQVLDMIIVDMMDIDDITAKFANVYLVNEKKPIKIKLSDYKLSIIE